MYYSALIPDIRYPMYDKDKKITNPPELPNGGYWNIFGSIHEKEYWCTMSICKREAIACIGDRVYHMDENLFSNIKEKNDDNIVIKGRLESEDIVVTDYSRIRVLQSSFEDYTYLHEEDLEFHVCPPPKNSLDGLAFMKFFMNDYVRQYNEVEIHKKYVEFLQSIKL